MPLTKKAISKINSAIKKKRKQKAELEEKFPMALDRKFVQKLLDKTNSEIKNLTDLLKS